MNNDLFFQSVGGKKLQHDDLKACGFSVGEDVWNFGWVNPGIRTEEQQIAHDTSVEAIPSLQIIGNKTDDPKKVCLYDYWKDPRVVGSVGHIYSGTHQFTGSCVGAGGGNTVFTLSAVEVVRLNDPEQALVPFWLLPYGRSRYYLGERGRGEGSTGGTFAKAISTDGVVPANLDGLPKFNNDDGLCWGASVEMTWSDGGRIDQKWLDLARVHLVKSTARCKSADDMREAIRNGYPCSWCGNWGGMMNPPVKGDPGVLLNPHASSWSHQQSCHAWWDHPTLGEIYYILNQWGLNAHGKDPAGGPPGGYWILKKDADWQCRNGEVYAFSQFAGFPSQELDFSAF